jgi:predicted ArsR family transcriptional regulator
MEASEVQVVVHPPPLETVYNKRMETKKLTRRSFLSRDVQKLLAKSPHLTRADIAKKLRAKSHSVKAVLFKLVAANKVACEKNAVNMSKTGPRMVNVYFLPTNTEETSNHG